VPSGVNAQAVRVARVITRLNIGGPAIQAISLSRDLRAEGFETTLLHGRLGAAEGDMTGMLPVGDTRLIYVGNLARPISPLRDFRACWQLYREFCRWRPQIIHTHMAKAGTLGRIAGLAYNRTAGRRRTARLIHTYHGHVFEGYFGAPSTRIFLSVERLLGACTDALIAISEEIRSDLLHTYRIATADRVRLIPLGFNLDRLLAIDSGARAAARKSLGISEPACVVTTVGRLTAIKEQSQFIEMASRVGTQSRPIVFLVVGDGELKPALVAQAQRLGVADRIRFLGWRGDLETIYGATDVFVLTSRNEGTPVALIESMASGVASVSTDVGGVRDVIIDGSVGRLVPLGDLQALSDAVASLCGAPADRLEMGQAARESVRRRFHVQRLVKDIRELYWQLLSNDGTIR
jgi:glycosyltransferase involved in cell wall biosynthesis